MLSALGLIILMVLSRGERVRIGGLGTSTPCPKCHVQHDLPWCKLVILS